MFKLRLYSYYVNSVGPIVGNSRDFQRICALMEAGKPGSQVCTRY